MFLTLLAVTFLVALGVAALVMRAFTPPIDRILRRIIADEISRGWLQFVRIGGNCMDAPMVLCHCADRLRSRANLRAPARQGRAWDLTLRWTSR